MKVSTKLLLAALIVSFFTINGNNVVLSAEKRPDASPTTNKPLSLAVQDQEFIQHAAQGNLAEVMLGKLAMKKATDEKVKELGQRMVQDHTKANDDLKEIAQKLGITLPKEPDMKQQSTLSELEGLSGKRFDEMYIQKMLHDHQEDIAAFEKESTRGLTPELKDYASKYLPKLRMHYEAFEQQQRIQYPKTKNNSNSSTTTNGQSPNQSAPNTTPSNR